jgi:hypothetical protein
VVALKLVGAAAMAVILYSHQLHLLLAAVVVVHFQEHQLP